jgi:hypothetical protein
VIHQLRIAETSEASKDASHTRFRDPAARIAPRYGFDIVAGWEAKEEKRATRSDGSCTKIDARKAFYRQIGNGMRSRRPRAIGAVSSAELKIAVAVPPTTPRRRSEGL